MAKKQSDQPDQGPSSLAVRSTSTYLPVDVLLAAPLNPRIHTGQQIRDLARSIRAFGFISPIIVDKSNRIVAGHGRLAAAKLLGIKEVPVVRADHLSEQEASREAPRIDMPSQSIPRI